MPRKFLLLLSLFLSLIFSGILFGATVDEELERNTAIVFYSWEYTDILGETHEESTRGNGVFVSYTEVLTCAHLFYGKPPGEIYVHYFPKKGLRMVTKAVVTKFVVRWDIALLEIELPITWEPLKLAEEAPAWGDTIYFSGKSSMDCPPIRKWYYSVNHRGIMVYPIYYGDSGGGVFNEKREIIGIIYQIILVNKGGNRFPTFIGYGIPLRILKEFLS